MELIYTMGVWGATTFSAPCWQQLVTATSLGVSQATALNFMNALNMGIAEITTCPSNTNVKQFAVR